MFERLKSCFEFCCGDFLVVVENVRMDDDDGIGRWVGWGVRVKVTDEGENEHAKCVDSQCY